MKLEKKLNSPQKINMFLQRIIRGEKEIDLNDLGINNSMEEDEEQDNSTLPAGHVHVPMPGTSRQASLNKNAEEPRVDKDDDHVEGLSATTNAVHEDREEESATTDAAPVDVVADTNYVNITAQ